MSMPQPMDFDDYCVLHGVSKHWPCDPGMHRTPRAPSRRAERAAMKRLIQAGADWQAARDQLLEKYDEEVQAGRIRPLTRLERTERAAAGNPELASTQAARRLLEKKRAVPTSN